MSCLVAICTPVLDGEAYLAQTLEAVQAQTYPHLVHVVSDNASSDGTAAVLARWRDARVPVIASRAPTRIPQMANWNRAVDLAPPQARWIRLLCADDLVAPDAVERMVALAESDHAIGLVGCGQTRNGAREDMFWGDEPVVVDGREACRRYFEYRGSLMGPHVLVRRDLLYAQGRPFDERLVFADNDMCLRVLQRSKFAFDPRPLAYTREHEGSVSADVICARRLHFFEWLVYLDRYGPLVYEPARHRAMRRAYMRHYLRRMAGWPRDVRRLHAKRLREYGEPAGPLRRLDALANWFGKRLGLQDGWVGYPF